MVWRIYNGSVIFVTYSSTQKIRLHIFRSCCITFKITFCLLFNFLPHDFRKCIVILFKWLCYIWTILFARCRHIDKRRNEFRKLVNNSCFHVKFFHTKLMNIYCVFCSLINAFAFFVLTIFHIFDFKVPGHFFGNFFFCVLYFVLKKAIM